jgi:hypothetical protein
MSHLRVAPLPMLALLLAMWPAASAQSVRSTRAGLVYFFDGYVFVGDEQLQQRFGRFPEIAEGSVLRTELGRAEVLLTPGVFLRVDENSAIRMQSNSLSDTRVELLRGSAIIEVSHEALSPRDTLIYKDWQVRVRADSVFRIDSAPAQLRVLSGTAEVSSESGSDSVTVQRGEILPFASVLVAEQATTPAADSFNIWAMNRTSIVSEDNNIAAGITDDPDQVDASGAALGSFSSFPQTGIPSLGINYPYGLSFWSPYQSLYPGWSNPWLNPYLSVNPYGLLYQRLPAGPALFSRPIYPGAIYPRPIGAPTGTGIIGRPVPRPTLPPTPRTQPAAGPHVAPPHSIRR